MQYTRTVTLQLIFLKLLPFVRFHTSFLSEAINSYTIRTIKRSSVVLWETSVFLCQKQPLSVEDMVVVTLQFFFELNYKSISYILNGKIVVLQYIYRLKLQR